VPNRFSGLESRLICLRLWGEEVLKERTTLSTESGILWVVATPIGNLDDLSPRAIAVLAQVAVVAAEDTRHTGLLLQRLGLAKPLLSLHEHNESARLERILAQLGQGADVALVSDAGTPLISDPGYRLVCAARAAGLTVRPVPGPSAVIAALSVSGLPTDRFCFVGFLPAVAGACRERIESLCAEPGTVVCFESAHRVVATAEILAKLIPDRPLALARELTKQFEEHFWGPAAELPAWLQAGPYRTRGEFVLAWAPAPHPPGESELSPQAQQTLRALRAELPLKQAVRLAAAATGEPRNRLYAWAIAHAGQE